MGLSAAPHDPGMLHAALAFTEAGCSVVRVRVDGTKTPAGAWKTNQTHRADRDQVTAWFTDGHPGLGVVCGAVSGNLEMLELEGRAVTDNVLHELSEIAFASGLANLWRCITLGYCEQTPSGGVHFLYRVDGPVPGNTKLARRPATPDELAANPDEKLKVLVETRGEGGFVVVAPSHGPVHPTGRPWTRAAGDPTTIPTISIDDHKMLHALCRMADRMPLPEPAGVTDPLDAINPPVRDGGLSPGDDYNNRGDWHDLLTRHGWTPVWRRGKETGWRRPGKTDPGISATTGYGDRGDWLYVFTTSTDFEPEKTYTLFAAYTVLEHHGDHSAAAAALRAAGYGTPPPEPTLRATFTSPPTTASSHAPAGAATATTTVISDAGLTDVGNADLFVNAHHDAIRYVPERGTWLVWGGSHWQWDSAGHVVELAKQTIKAIPTDDKTLAKHRHRSLTRRAVEATVALARTDKNVVAPAALLDADPYALCTPSGVIDLTTGAVKPADRSDLHTRATAVPYDPDMPTPRWDAFLADTFADDKQMLDFVQRLAGYSATGIVTHHVLPFLHGNGQNGKSVFLDVMRRVLGDYAATAPAGFLLAGAQQQHETEIARLAGLRFVVCSEVNQQARFDEAKVKLLTGGDALTARFMHQNHFTFVPSHHLWLMGNHQPRIDAGGESFERRLRLIAFAHKVPDDKKIEGLDRLLADEEGPGILAWIVNGARQAFADGLPAPDSVLTATRTYMEEEDDLARFIDDRCLIGGSSLVRVATAQMRAAYETWCREEGLQPFPPQVFGRELRTRYGLHQTRSNGRRFYLGVTLLSDAEEPDPEPHWTDR